MSSQENCEKVMREHKTLVTHYDALHGKYERLEKEHEKTKENLSSFLESRCPKCKAQVYVETCTDQIAVIVCTSKTCDWEQSYCTCCER